MRGDTRLARIFGIDLKLHASWWLVAILLSWVLASQFFPQFYPELTVNQHWFVAIISTLLLFVSVLLHELSHSFVARKKGIHFHSITLFFFGGVADIESEDMKPLDEFLMAIAGPFFSFFLAGVCAIIFIRTTNFLILNAIAYYLFQLNLALGLFNLVPGYPLDGGRALRAILHHFTKNLRTATKIASTIGKSFAIFLIFVGIFQLVSKSFAGLWVIAIGIFLYFVAGLSYEQVIFYDVLKNWKVSQFQVKAQAKVMVKGDINLKQFLQDHIADKHKTFIVKKGKEAYAILDLSSVKAIRGDALDKVNINDVAIPLKQLGTLTQDQSAYTAFKKFLAGGAQVLSVKKTLESPKVDGLVFKEQLMNALVRRLKFGVDFEASNNAVKKEIKKTVGVSKKQVAKAKEILSGKNSKKKSKKNNGQKSKTTVKKKKHRKEHEKLKQRFKIQLIHYQCQNFQEINFTILKFLYILLMCATIFLY